MLYSIDKYFLLIHFLCPKPTIARICFRSVPLIKEYLYRVFIYFRKIVRFQSLSFYRSSFYCIQ